MIIKLCGNKDAGVVQELQDAGLDYAGFIFYNGSPRNAIDKLDGSLMKTLTIKKVGVFVNETVKEIMRLVELFNLDAVQLHGDETPSFCNQVSEHLQVIKAFRINNNPQEIEWMIKDFMEVCDYYLFDKGSKAVYGGTGEKFDWNLLNDLKIGKPFFLSGGIESGDVEKLKAFTHPDFFGIDINSKFETKPGVKDVNLVKKFIYRIKQK